MALEVPTYINDLVTANPADGDTANYGAAHLRNLKTAIKNTFLNGTVPFGLPTFVTKSGDYTVLSTDDGTVFLVDASGGNRTITLPTIASVYNRFRVAVIKSDSSANTVTLQRAGADTIIGANTLVLATQYSMAEVGSSGASPWQVLQRWGKTVADMGFTDVANKSQILSDEIYVNAPIVTTYTYALDRKFGGTFNEVSMKLTSGTATARLLINGVAVTGSQISVTTSKQTSACTAANVFVSGNDVALQVTAIGSAVGLSVTAKYTRSLA